MDCFNSVCFWSQWSIWAGWKQVKSDTKWILYKFTERRVFRAVMENFGRKRIWAVLKNGTWARVELEGTTWIQAEAARNQRSKPTHIKLTPLPWTEINSLWKTGLWSPCQRIWTLSYSRWEALKGLRKASSLVE